MQAKPSSSIEGASDQKETRSKQDAQNEAAKVNDDDDKSPPPSSHEQKKASTLKTSTEQNNTEKSSSKNKQKLGHIMISYHWDHQDMMLKVGVFNFFS